MNYVNVLIGCQRWWRGNLPGTTYRTCSGFPLNIQNSRRLWLIGRSADGLTPPTPPPSTRPKTGCPPESHNWHTGIFLPVVLNPDYNICGGFSISPCWLWSYELVNFRSPNPRKVTIVPDSKGGVGVGVNIPLVSKLQVYFHASTKLWILLRWSNILLEFRILSSCVA